MAGGGFAFLPPLMPGAPAVVPAPAPPLLPLAGVPLPAPAAIAALLALPALAALPAMPAHGGGMILPAPADAAAAPAEEPWTEGVILVLHEIAAGFVASNFDDVPGNLLGGDPWAEEYLQLQLSNPNVWFTPGATLRLQVVRGRRPRRQF